MAKKYTYEDNGILSAPRVGKDGRTYKLYFIRVGWKGKRPIEKAGRTMAQAFKLLEKRRAEVDNRTYVPPRERKRAEREALTSDGDLVFQVATRRFLEDCGGDYAKVGEVRAMLDRLALAFKGRRLDEITRADVDLYFRQRLRHKGPFAKWKRRTGLRSPQRELVQLSQVYRYMQDRGFDLENPCLRPINRGRLVKGKARTYVPERQPVIPSLEALGAIFAARPPRFTDHDAALILLAYYTGGRPESDLLRLRHGDVQLVDDKVVGLDGKPILGSVRFADPKTPAGIRTIPLHPQLVPALRAIMEPEPADAEARDGWLERPLFRTWTSPRRAKSSEAPSKPELRVWDQHSYRKTWANVVKEAGEKHPAIRRMILRDLRKTFRTFLTNAGAPEPTIRRLMGHSVDVSQGYHELTDDVARATILALPVPPIPSPEVANRVAISAVNAVSV